MSAAVAYEYLWFFFLYAFLGWCSEVCFAAAKDGGFVNRGFLNGPVCPIYGFGVVIVVGLLTPVKENVFLLFFCSVILTSALEWVTGFVLEKVFRQRWWDYTDMPFNLNGYVCLLFSLLWGLACLLIMDVVHPMIAGLVALVPHTLGLALVCLFSALMLADLAAAVASVTKLNKRLRQIDELAAKIKAASNELGENLAGGVLTLTEKGETLREDLEEKKASLAGRRAAREAGQEQMRAVREVALRRRQAALEELRAANEDLLRTYHFGQRRLLRAFPDMKSTRHSEALEAVKERLGRGRNRRK